MTIKFLRENLYAFYRQDCCWPYAASFFFVLLIYWLDFFTVHTRFHWASLVAYGIISAYYFYNISLYSHNKLKAKDVKFFMFYLSIKIVVWGVILTLLYAMR